MQSGGYSPYQNQARRRKSSSLKINLSGKTKKWLLGIFGTVGFLFILFYLSLGELRFVVNHYFGLTFFRKHYVVLLQNNYELRPGGGFITGYGEITTTLGIPTSISFDNSYRIAAPEDYVAPPYPHEKFLKNEWYEGYSFRDANWNPNFPESAKILKEFYQKQFPEKEVDGFIVINFSWVEDWVEALGGIKINGQKVDGDHLFSLITQEVNNVDRHNEEQLLERKNILTPLAQALISKAKWHPFITRDALEQGLAQKEVYVWLESDRLQHRLEQRDWANHLVVKEGVDFVALNIANLGSKKSDRYLQKELHQSINLIGASPVVQTEVVFRLPGGFNPYLTDYKGYMRLYLPKGVEVTQNPMQSAVLEEGDFKVIAHELNIPLGGKLILNYQYTLPPGLWDWKTYQLDLIKQSGSELFVTVMAEVPAYQQLESETFEPRENRAFWQGKLDRDQTLELTLLPDLLSPYPIEQKFKDLKTIVVDWSETLEDLSVRDALNYTLEDQNLTNAAVTDKAKVVYAELKGAQLTLEVEGITEQPLERYKLSINKVRDTAGNPTDPEVLQVTVVQRLEEKKEEIKSEE